MLKAVMVCHIDLAIRFKANLRYRRGLAMAYAAQLGPDLDKMDDAPIILFDAECVLCSANALFVLRHDREGHFRLASMQGEIGAALCRAHGVDPRHPSSIIIIEKLRVRQDSDAVLSIYEALAFPWRMLTVFRILPRFMRDPIYRCIAKNRYRLFGKRSSCWVAPPEYQSRIL